MHRAVKSDFAILNLISFEQRHPIVPGTLIKVRLFLNRDSAPMLQTNLSRPCVVLKINYQ
jgi:hypothetical protein